jgi:hypothetical protein
MQLNRAMARVGWVIRFWGPIFAFPELFISPQKLAQHEDLPVAANERKWCILPRATNST